MPIQSPRFDDAFRALAAERLARFPREAVRDETLRPAAVALVLTPGPAGEASFVITRRTARLARHAHQWALPGGRLDAGETAIDAALRETGEEVGLTLSRDCVLGLLDDFPTRSGFRMTPVVVWGGEDDRPLANPDEVERVHVVPLGGLRKPEVPVLRMIPERLGSRYAAVLAVVGTLNIPLVMMATRLWRTIHPQVINNPQGGIQDPAMKTTLGLSMLAFLVLFTVLWALRMRILRLEERVDVLLFEAAEGGHHR